MRRLRAVLLVTVALGLVLTASAAAVAPSVNITGGPSGLVNSDDATFTFTVDDPLATVECKVDDGGFNPCDSSTSHTYNNLPDGGHTFTVRATNALEEMGQDSRTWTIDTTPPNTTIDSGPSGTVNSKNATFTFSGASAFDCKLDDGPFEACNSGSKSYSGLDDGSHTFQVRAVDAAGNEDPSPASRTWTVDASAPTVSIGQKPSNPSTTTTARFTFSSNEGGATFRCTLDGGATQTCTSPKDYSGLGAGGHQFRVFAVDGGGNQSDEAVYNWTIGFPPANESRPTITGTAQEGEELTANPGTWSGTGSPSFSYAWQRCNEGGGGCQNVSSGRTRPLDDEDVGHKMRVVVTAENDYGDASEASNLVPAEGVVSDVTAPQIELLRSPAKVTRRKKAVFAFSSDDRHATFACKRDRQADFRPCTSPVRYKGLRAGDHVFHIRATDRSGKPNNETHEWTIDRTPPPPPTRVAAQSGDGIAVVAWAKPLVGDFAFVRVVRFASKGVVVYQGKRAKFRDRKVKNGKRYVYKVRAFDRAGNRSRVVKRAVRPRNALVRPRNGARIRITRPPLFRWRADPNAAQYNLQLYRLAPSGWRKVQSVFPSRPSYQLPRKWRFEGKRQRFRPGSYVAYVWPWYGSRYGLQIGSKRFSAFKR